MRANGCLGDEARLTFAVAALAVVHDLQHTTETLDHKIVQKLRKIHTTVIYIDGHVLTARSPLDDDAAAIVDPTQVRLIESEVPPSRLTSLTAADRALAVGTR